MERTAVRFFSLLAALVLTGCAVHHYQAAPIVPAETAARFEARSLADPGLKVFLEKNLGRQIAIWPPPVWDLQRLSLAALYFNPAMDAARSRAAEAQAAVITAGARPNPTLSVSPGVPSPYLFSLDLAEPIETAGKRGYRIRAAQSLSEAARLDLVQTAWTVWSGVRAALLNYLLESRTLDLLRSEAEVRGEQVQLLQQRLAAGEIALPAVSLERIALSQTRLAIRAAEGQLGQDRASLAASIGMPAEALDGVQLSWMDLESPPGVESLSPQIIQRDAVLNRLDVRSALAQYQATEAGLQLEIARQYPNVNIGPGYTYEETNNFFTLGVSVTLPVFNRNQGPIAQAEARRQGAAAAFLAKQAQVIAQSERALALYKSALAEYAEATNSLRKLEDEQERMTRQAVRVGEQDRLTLDTARIETIVAAQARLDALGRAQTALGQLEGAVQRPLDPNESRPPTPGIAAPSAQNLEESR
jgi:outer membrane protein, heavy metal efflux system